MIRRAVTVGALALLAAGCAWPTAGYDPTRGARSPDRTVTPENAKNLKLLWGPISGTGGEVVGNGDVIVTTRVTGSGIVARDPATGTERWHADTAVNSEPTIGDGNVTTAGGTDRCGVQQFDLATGAPVRSARVGTEFLDAPLTTACLTGPAVLLDATHLVVTTASTVTRSSPGCAGASPPQLWGLTTTVTVMDHALAPQWEIADAHLGCGTPPALSRFVTPDVARVGDRYIVTRGHDVLGLPVDCGSPCAPTWTHTLSGNPFAPMGLPTGEAFVQKGESYQPTVLDPATGAVRWTAVSESEFFAAAVTDKYIITPGTTVQAYPVGGCGAPTCAPAWSVALNTITPTQPVSVAGDVVFTGKWEVAGDLIDARGCGAATCYPIGSIASGYMHRTTVIGGRVFVPDQGGLIAYALPPG